MTEPLETSQDEATAPSLGDRVRKELRERPLAWGVMAGFTIAGPVVTRFMFPEAPISIGIAGGLAFGIYAALCAVPGRFL